ncbi:MAG TPA: hypothetical protein VKV95_24010 [Terriglobia bacterium]|nr:hypothetical protein [Terriglobia bacterium]
MRIQMFLSPVLAALLPLSGAARKPSGMIHDSQAFAQVHNFCLVTNGLPDSAQTQIRKFVERENKPRKMLGKLSWKYVEQCSSADARITFSFSQTTGVGEGTSRGTLQGSPTNSLQTTFTRVEITVLDRSAENTIYSVEGDAVEGDLSNAIDSPFSKLERDLKDAGAAKH